MKLRYQRLLNKVSLEYSHSDPSRRRDCFYAGGRVEGPGPRPHGLQRKHPWQPGLRRKRGSLALPSATVTKNRGHGPRRDSSPLLPEDVRGGVSAGS